MIDLLTKVLNMRWDFFFYLNLSKSGDFSLYSLPFSGLLSLYNDHGSLLLLYFKKYHWTRKKIQRHLHIQMVFSLEKKQ